MTWSYLIVLIAPTEYTELKIIFPYVLAATFFYPFGAWILKLRFEKNSRRVSQTGSLTAKKRYKLLSAIDMLLIPSFKMACSTGMSLLLTVLYNYYFASAVENSSAGVSTLFWVGISLGLQGLIFLIEVGKHCPNPNPNPNPNLNPDQGRHALRRRGLPSPCRCDPLVV